MKFFINQKIGLKLIIAITLSFIIAITINITLAITQFSSYNYDFSEEQAIKGMRGLETELNNLKNKALDFGNILSVHPDIVNSIEERDFNNLNFTLDLLKNKSGVDFITVTDGNGTVIARTHDPEKIGDNITSQVNIQTALSGKAFSTFEEGNSIGFAARAGVPIYGDSDEIIGVVSTGYRLDTWSILDNLKQIYNTELTLFLGDLRYNTTIQMNGQRILGTKLDSSIADRILLRNEQYSGNANILESQYVVAYKPLIDGNNQTIGVIFAGQEFGEVVAARNRIAVSILIVTFILIAVLLVFVGVFVRKVITKPLGNLVEVSNTLAKGDVDISVHSTSKDEIGELTTSFGKMIDNIKHQANAAEKIAQGDLNVNIKPKSEKDILSNSMNLVASSLSSLVNETQMLTRSAVDGELDTRGDITKFNGVYREIIEGVNSTLDAVLEPVKEASQVLQKLSTGNLKEYVMGNYKGDHAVIKDSLNSTVKILSEYISEITYVLTQLSKGNLNISINSEYKGDFIEIKNSLNLIVDSFNTVLLEINNASEQVASGAKQVSETSMSLSQGSTEQASSIEELSSSVEEVANQTKQNAVSANQANELALTAKNTAVEGNERMYEMLQAINKINEASGNISKIIKVIDEIAFQTNILALNAAVEAARAGQYGKGFAVVAEEVRNLAGKSSNAAKETSALIEGSIEKVETGTKIANETAEALSRIVDDIDKVFNYVGSIADSSNHQATAISQINDGINQVSQVVQTNSAISEECAAASQELSSHSQILKELVGKFELKAIDLKKVKSQELSPEIIKMLEQLAFNKQPRDTAQTPKNHKNNKHIIDLKDSDFGKY
ncbi:UNVERIFIED_CONTAM: methyl-accepting chemotaxis protein [Acetivibrio alkalicellulosi]